MKAVEVINEANATARWLEELAAADARPGAAPGIPADLRTAHRAELRRALLAARDSLADLGTLTGKPGWAWLDAPPSALVSAGGRGRAERAAADLETVRAAGLAVAQLASAARLVALRYVDASAADPPLS